MSEPNKEEPPKLSPEAAQALALLGPRKPPTPAQVAWGILGSFVAFLVVAAVCGYIFKLGWNGLSDTTGLSTIDFIDGVCAFLILRITAIALLLHRKRK